MQQINLPLKYWNQNRKIKRKLYDPYHWCLHGCGKRVTHNGLHQKDMDKYGLKKKYTCNNCKTHYTREELATVQSMTQSTVHQKKVKVKEQ